MAGGINIGSIESTVIVDTGGSEQKLAAARQAMAATAAALKALDAQFVAGGVDAATYGVKMRELIATFQSLEQAGRAAAASIGVTDNAMGGLDAGLGKATGGAKGYGQALAQIGYAVDDLQYGFAGIANNIQPILGSIPALAEYAGPISIAAIAAYQLAKHWDLVREAFGDTTPMQEAMRSLEGLEAALKNLKADASGMSFWESLAVGMGFNPDAGKAGQAANLGGRVKERKEAEANAKSLEGQHTDDQKKAAERFGDALAESGGMEKAADALAAEAMKRRGAGSFLSVEKSLGGAGKSERDEYAGLAGRDDLTHDEKTRKADLEEMARQRSVEEARLDIGRAKFDPEKQKAIGARVGGEDGGLLAGDTQTTKEIDDEAKAKDKAMRSRALIDDRDLRNAAAEERKNQQGVREVEQWEAQQEREKEQKDKKFANESQRKAHEAVPGFNRMAEAGAARIDAGENTFGVHREMADVLVKAGLNREEAVTAIGEELGDARKRLNDRAEQRGRGGRGDGGKEEMARSEVFDTAGLTAKIQSGVTSGNDIKRTAENSEKMVGLLAAIKDQKPGQFRVK